MRKWSIAAAVILSALALAAFDCRLIVRRYSVDALEISSSIRIALVTDLHSCRYGENQRTLIDAVCGQNPDLVLLGGDIFDDDLTDENAEKFIAGIAQEYPCYYVAGNHEYWSGEERFAKKMAILEKYGIVLLFGKSETVEVNGQRINLCGADDPDAFSFEGNEEAFLAQLSQLGQAGEGAFTVLLSHRPEYWEEYRKYSFDLVLSGHAHGGQWRIPGLLNGLFAPNQGLFPDLAGGRYEQDGVTMIVSRGLARESTRVPRIFNRPELVIVDIL